MTHLLQHSTNKPPFPFPLRYLLCFMSKPLYLRCRAFNTKASQSVCPRFSSCRDERAALRTVTQTHGWGDSVPHRTPAAVCHTMLPKADGDTL